MRKVELLPTRDCEAGYGPATSAADKWFPMYPSVFIALLVHLSLFFCLYSQNSVNFHFVIGIFKYEGQMKGVGPIS